MEQSNSPGVTPSRPIQGQENTGTSSNGLTRRETEELQMMMSQIVTESPKLAPKQIDKILAQRDKVLDYQHKDNQRAFDLEEKNQVSSKQVLFGLGVFILLIIVVVGFFDKTYIGDLIKVLVGFFGGSGTGYAIANHNKTDKS